jgi:aconitate hydratase
MVAISSSPLNLTQQLIRDRLVSGEMSPGKEIALRMDQARL